jgi:mycothiol synthase
MAEPAVTIHTTEIVTPGEQDQIRTLLDVAAAADRHRAVNDAGLLALRRSESVTDTDKGNPIHALAYDRSGAIIGYGQVVWEESGPVAALVVDPANRRRGIGAGLWRALADGTPAPLRIWASGNSPAAQALAARLGLAPIRTLLVLGRSLGGDQPPADPPPGITIRTFRPGDEEGWLAVNARAFASHPEQGAMTRTDLDQRLAEPWFDPAGLLLAIRAADEQIVGFHWTKREPGASTGEVYVIGVDPDAGVRGLGTPLLGAGLRYLRDSGATDVDLYVESDNVRALALYHRYGFTPVTSDAMYAATAGVSG